MQILVGDIVQLSRAPKTEIGVVISPKKNKFMVGPVFEVLVDGRVKYVREEDLNFVFRGGQHES